MVHSNDHGSDNVISDHLLQRLLVKQGKIVNIRRPFMEFKERVPGYGVELLTTTA
jgi:hypothetical protein